MNLFEKIITWYFSKSSLPYWCIFLIDCLIVFLSAFVVFWAVHGGLNTLNHSYALARVMLLYLFVCIGCFRLFHTYSGIIRYSSFSDLARVAYANGLSCLLVFILHYWVNTISRRTFVHLRAVDECVPDRDHADPCNHLYGPHGCEAHADRNDPGTVYHRLFLDFP